MKDLSGVVLGVAGIAGYLSYTDVDSIYFSVGDALTLGDFARDIVYDGFSHKVIASDNLDNNERHI
jgi:hypothetical protein